MKKKLPLAAVAILTAGVALFAPSAAHADGGATVTGGTTSLTVVDANGAPRAGIVVSIASTDDLDSRTGNDMRPQADRLASVGDNDDRAQALRDQATRNERAGISTAANHRADGMVVYTAVTDAAGRVVVPSSGHLSPSIRVYAGVGTTATATIANPSRLDASGIVFDQTVRTDRSTLTASSSQMTMARAYRADLDSSLTLRVP